MGSSNEQTGEPMIYGYMQIIPEPFFPKNVQIKFERDLAKYGGYQWSIYADNQKDLVDTLRLLSMYFNEEARKIMSPGVKV